ncbi:hypothetical protein JTT01_20275 [Clostridium botulinum]|nr:hypothetical protein [Clostridium botulinum]MCS4465889.1 hypothetical protein [Clostridium botulinum]MCS4524544.1 hypothetical protein [Clostridium botulinum]
MKNKLCCDGVNNLKKICMVSTTHILMDSRIYYKEAISLKIMDMMLLVYMLEEKIQVASQRRA